MLIERIKTWAIILLTLSNLFGITAAYIKGNRDGASRTEAKYRKLIADQEFAYQLERNRWQVNLQKITESNNQQKLTITTLEGNLKNEREKNITLLNANNRLTKQFTRMLDASTRTEAGIMHPAAGNESDAYTSSTVAPDRILSVIQTNNINHLKCITDLNAWIDWYRMNLNIGHKTTAD